ncbi:hypothetical protein [Halorussus lipolyticus]|uniref:hypothetical protein n=1 Tax=Halorussus lipolyticus TaxID=3034024 RepID=UPI0023E87161|nr:hypothetical protein [Halorussus sp. DT80]
MRPTFVLLLAVVALVGATGAVAADGGDQTGVQNGTVAEQQAGGQNQTAGGQQAGGQNETTGEQQAGWQNQTTGENRTDGPNRSAPQAKSSSELGLQDQSSQSPPPWPDEDDTTGNDSNATTTGVSPGQQLAGAVGAQGASLQGDLWNRTLAGRLRNATTPGERAEVLRNEVKLLESNLAALQSVRGNLTEEWADGEISEGQYRASLSEFVVRARTVELRANQTARVAEELSVRTRETHDVNVSYIRSLGEEAHALYQFEDEIGQEVANETLANQSMAELPMGDSEDEDKRSDER